MATLPADQTLWRTEHVGAENGPLLAGWIRATLRHDNAFRRVPPICQQCRRKKWIGYVRLVVGVDKRLHVAGPLLCRRCFHPTMFEHRVHQTSTAPSIDLKDITSWPEPAPAAVPLRSTILRGAKEAPMDRRSGVRLKEDYGRLFRYLVDRPATVSITANAVTTGARFSESRKTWVARVLCALGKQGLLSRINRTHWRPVPERWNREHLMAALSIPPPPVPVPLPAPVPAPVPVSDYGTGRREQPDRLQQAIKAEYFDRLVKKYGEGVIRDALGVSALPSRVV